MITQTRSDREGKEPCIFLAREVFQPKAGKAGELVKTFKRYNRLSRGRNFKKGKICTDISGEYWTVDYEREIRSVDALARDSRRISRDPKLRALFKDYHALVEGGHRALYKAEQ